MRKYFLLFSLFLLPFTALAQFTSVTATITEPSSQTWNNGKYSATLVNPQPQVPPSVNGTNLTAAQMSISGSISGSGVITATLADNSVVVPAGTYWQFTLCPNASAQCQTETATVSGASQNISSALSAHLRNISFPASSSAYGYSDGEVSPTPNPGGTYYNVTSLLQRVWTGAAWVNGSGSSFITSLSTTGTSGAAVVNLGNLNIPVYSSGSALPTATAPGQIISSDGAGTAYSVQAQVFWARSGDTIASIESECSSVCFYNVTDPQTITLSANHSLSANVYVNFLSGGKWTVNGVGDVLTIPNQVTGTISQHFAGTATVSFGVKQQYVPVEWFGAVGGSSLPVTDSTPMAQLAANSLATAGTGQIFYQGQYYLQSGTLALPSGVGLKGTGQGTQIWTNSATADQIQVGSAGTHASSNVLQDFHLWATVPRTGTSNGVYLNNTDGIRLENCGAGQSVYPFHIHNSSIASNGGIFNCLAQFSVAGTTARAGFYFDSMDGVQNASQYMVNSGTLVVANPDGAVLYGKLIQGSHINDFTSYNSGSAGTTTAVFINYTGTLSSGDAASDIHLFGDIDDVCTGPCVIIDNLPTSGIAGSNVEISGGYFFTNTTGIVTMKIDAGFGISIHDAQINGQASGGIGIYVNGGSNLLIAHNTMMNLQATGILLGDTTSTSVIGNILQAKTADTDSLIYQAGASTANTISGNVLQGGDGANTVGINITTGYAAGLETNAYGTGLGHKCFLNGGPCPITPPTTVTIAGLPAASSYPVGGMVIVSDATTFTPGTCTGGGSDYMIAVSNGTSWSCH